MAIAESDTDGIASIQAAPGVILAAAALLVLVGGLYFFKRRTFGAAQAS